MGKDKFDPYDLDQFYDIIQKMYIDQNQSVDQIVRALRPKGVRASKNMFIKKIRAWGLKKYISRKEMLLLMGTVLAGSTAESFTVNGRIVSKDAVLEYFNKQPESAIKLTPKETSNRSTSWQVFVPQTSLNLKLPDILELPQQLFQSISDIQRQYVAHTLTLGESRHAQGATQSNLAYRSYLDLTYGSDLLQQGLNQLATPLLERGLRTITMELSHLELQEQLTYGPLLCYLAQLILYFRMPDLSETITRYLHRLFNQQLGNHILTQVAKFVYENRDSMETLQLGLDVAFDATKSLVGDDHPISMSMFRRKTFSVAMAGNTSEIQSNLEALMTSCNRLPDDHNERLEIEQDYGHHLITNGQYAKGMSLIQNQSRYIHEKEPPADLLFRIVVIRSCYIEADSILRQPQYQGFDEDEISSNNRFRRVESLLKTTLEKAVSWIGPHNVQTIKTAQILADLYEDRGYVVESQVQKDYILEQLKEYRLS